MPDEQSSPVKRRRSSQKRSHATAELVEAPLATPKRSRRDRPRPTSAGQYIKDNAIGLSLLGLLIVALLAEMPWVARSIRADVMRGLIAVLFSLFAFVGFWGKVDASELKRGSNPWILALLAWSVGETIFAPAGFTAFGRMLRPFAVTELMRIVLCVAVYAAAAYVVPVHQVKSLIMGLLVAGTAIALYGLFVYGQGPVPGVSDEMTSIFGNHEQVASYLLMLLPAAIVLACFKSNDQSQVLISSGVTIVIGAALLLSRTRSAWVGAVAAVIAIVYLALRYSPLTINRANKFLIVGPALIVVFGFMGLAYTGELRPLISSRAHTFAALGDDASLGIRLHRWKAACRMTYERPLTGWGLGSFPVLQQAWTGTGDAPDDVVKHGTGHSNLAHNFWVQWSSETGVIGLGLYVAMIVSFIGYAVRKLKVSTKQSSRTLVFVGIASAIAASVDMVGAPSYTFPGVSSLPWLWMGLAMGSIRANEASLVAEPEAVKPWPAIAVPVAVAVLAAAVILWVGAHQPGTIYEQ